MDDLRYGLHLAKKGWAVYEVETRRLIAIDDVPQTGLKFVLAARAARLLNSGGWAVHGKGRGRREHAPETTPS